MKYRLIQFLIVFQVFSTPAFPICKELLAQLNVTDLFSRQKIMRVAAEAVIRDRLAKGQSIPDLNADILQTCAGGNCVLLNFMDLLKVEVELGTAEFPVPMIQYNGRRVFKVETPTGTQYFRPAEYDSFDQDGVQKARRTLAAYRLNHSMGLKTASKARWARVNGILGTLSEHAPGQPIDKKLPELVIEGKADARSVADAVAFEFLIGNGDGTFNNLHLDESGQVHVFDHDWAFNASLIPTQNEDIAPDRARVAVGLRLPMKYTPEFIAALNKLSIKTLNKKLDYLLSETEIEGILFRREIILKDIELRGGAALLK